MRLFRFIDFRLGFGFNPRTRMGCDLFQSKSRHPAVMFQSTHPHGVRHIAVIRRTEVFSFNPRTRMGCDIKVANSLDIKKCFNPRTRMGCDLEIHITRKPTISFNPRTRMGCDSLLTTDFADTTSFNPRTRMGCDWRYFPSAINRLGFNPRTRMGCDACALRSCKISNVSIHAPAWGATVYSAMS